jgi:SecD/SecF fusion protein
MQLKGLVRFFAIALILICVYQLSFTWIVRNHENAMNEKADLWLTALYPTPEKKYPGNKDLQDRFSDTLDRLKQQKLQRLLDSTSNTKIGLFGLTTYQSAKDKELKLGLDLQGGMGVTMEVGLGDLLRSLANYSKDPAFTKSLDAAIARKATTNADLISLFEEEWNRNAPNRPLAPLFLNRSGEKIKFESTNSQVVAYLRQQASDAFENTYRILSTRIDRFGVASPTINPDPEKGVINIELAGVKDPERVRKYLQSTANLQFFEVYNIADIQEPLLTAEKNLSDYLKGIKPDSTKPALTPNSGAEQTTSASKTVDTTKIGTFGEVDTTKNNTVNTGTPGKPKVDSLELMRKEAPIRTLFAFVPQPEQEKNGQVRYPAAIAYVQKTDTGLLNQYLSMDLVKSKMPANLVFMYGKPENSQEGNENILAFYAIKTLENGQARLEGDKIEKASQQYDERSRPSISMEMNGEGARIWSQMTKANIGKPIAIVLDNVVYSAPNVQGEIPNGSSQISGSFTVQEAQDMADILQSGKLPAPARIVQAQEVGATLGKEAITGGSMAFLISFVVIFALMLIYYNTAGWVANIALILNLLFTIGVLSALGFTLTAPGIAGLVLTIGMAVDTNVIIFERIKEELNRGKSYSLAVSDGYKRSYAPVIDAHVTTFLTALILFTFGLGPVLGFATTQMIGIILSLFCGILISRLITDFYTNKSRHFEYFTNLSRKIFKKANFKFIEYRKIAYGISVVVLLLGIGSFFNGFDEGVEFAGGRSYTIQFDKVPDVSKMRSDLEAVFGEPPVIKTVGTDDQLNITTAYKIEETNPSVDSLVENTLFNGLKNFLPAGTTYKDYITRFKKGSQAVQPSISEDLKTGATKATIFSIIIICLYIFIRFRDWRYSLGTIVALLHDVFVTLAVFSFLKGIVPFPLEIDQHFIAAVLTVIGFSMNDTVIVYDRIREDSKLMKGASKTEIINTAINQTLSRTIMTSLTVFLTILILFIFGGDVTRGFAFAMLIGVITGTYSSIFVAAPILVDFAKDKPLGEAGVTASASKPVPVASGLRK